MAISLVAIGAKVTAYIANLIISVVNQQGYTQVIPTSVSGTGVTLGTYGKVALSTSTAPIVNGCFTSTYQSYVIEVEGVAAANASWVFVFTASGTPVTSNNYDYTELLGRNSAASSSTTTAQASWAILPSGVQQKFTIELAYPAVAQATTGMLRGSFHEATPTASTNNGVVVKTLTHRLAASYDGFRLTCSQNFTGTIRVFGVANN